MDTTLRGPQSLSGHFWDAKKSIAGIQTQNVAARSLVSTMTTPSRLQVRIIINIKIIIISMFGE
jgi:hypothetical protein